MSDAAIAVAVARMLRDGEVCFVGVGLPSLAAMLAQRSLAPNLYLVYESGVLGTRPPQLPLSVADPGLAGTAQTLVPVPEMFNYWLQGGHVDVGLLGAAQVDRFGNVNSTVVGDGYDRPRVRLPGAGGAPEIASAAGRVVIMVRQSVRSFVSAVDFVTTAGQRVGDTTRRDLGFPGRGPVAVVTDIGIYEPDPDDGELVLVALQPGRSVEEARAATGWDLRVAPEPRRLLPPTASEQAVLTALEGSPAP
ncbi:MAG TPA: CoA-transferase [Capillimicrobium sp.]|nr:CoA-transferase [Capillimicrobium sp.]